MALVDAEPAPFPLDASSVALIVIDMQRDFLEPGGFGAGLGNDVTRLQAIVPATARLIAGFRAAGRPVIHTRECHRPDLSDCPPAKLRRGAPGLRIGDAGPMGRILVAGEPGAEIVAELAPLPAETVIDKPGKGAFYATGLGETLERLGVRQLVLAGVTTEVCVQTTMREANDRGFDCLLAEDATESYFPEFKQATLAMVRAQGAIVGWTASVDAVLEGLGGLSAVFPALLGAHADAVYEPFREGVEICHLSPAVEGRGPALALLRYGPGACVPEHEHVGMETICVLAGSQSDDAGTYRQGDVVVNAAGSRHRVWSAEGCTVLIHWAEPVRILDEA